MVTVDSIGDYKIVNGTTDEVLQQLNSDDVVRQNVLGFEYVDATNVTVIYYVSP